MASTSTPLRRPAGTRGGALRERLKLGTDRRVAVFVGSEWKRKGLAQAIQAPSRATGWDLLVVGQVTVTATRAWPRAKGSPAPSAGPASRAMSRRSTSSPTRWSSPPSTRRSRWWRSRRRPAAFRSSPRPSTACASWSTTASRAFWSSRDPQQIADRLIHLGGDAELRERLGAAARHSALGYSWERMVESHHELYARAPIDGCGAASDQARDPWRACPPRMP